MFQNPIVIIMQDLIVVSGMAFGMSFFKLIKDKISENKKGRD